MSLEAIHRTGFKKAGRYGHSWPLAPTYSIFGRLGVRLFTTFIFYHLCRLPLVVSLLSRSCSCFFCYFLLLLIGVLHVLDLQSIFKFQVLSLVKNAPKFQLFSGPSTCFWVQSLPEETVHCFKFLDSPIAPLLVPTSNPVTTPPGSPSLQQVTTLDNIFLVIMPRQCPQACHGVAYYRHVENSTPCNRQNPILVAIGPTCHYRGKMKLPVQRGSSLEREAASQKYRYNQWNFKLGPGRWSHPSEFN